MRLAGSNKASAAVDLLSFGIRFEEQISADFSGFGSSLLCTAKLRGYMSALGSTGWQLEECARVYLLKEEEEEEKGWS